MEKFIKSLLSDGFYYIGSTCNELKVRKQAHKNKSNEKGSENRKIYKHIKDNNMEWKDIHIVLYEECPCEIKSELLIRESQILRLFCHDEFCLNIRVNTFFDGSSQEQEILLFNFSCVPLKIIGNCIFSSSTSKL